VIKSDERQDFQPSQALRLHLHLEVLGYGGQHYRQGYAGAPERRYAPRGFGVLAQGNSLPMCENGWALPDQRIGSGFDDEIVV
jgi:hypothetical protein